MHLKAQRPIFVPDPYIGELEKLSKAALMDMVWDLATRCSGGDSLETAEIIAEVRHTAEVITSYRKQEREHAQRPAT